MNTTDIVDNLLDMIDAHPRRAEGADEVIDAWINTNGDDQTCIAILDDIGDVDLSEPKPDLSEGWGKVKRQLAYNALYRAVLERGLPLDECADCGGSTAPGAPDPHVCGVIALRDRKPFDALRAARGRVVEIDREMFEYMLNVMPPRYARGCFAMGEPCSHEDAGPTYSWAREHNDRWYATFGTRAEAEALLSGFTGIRS